MDLNILISAAAERKHDENYESAVRRAGGLPRTGYLPAVDLNCAGLLLCGGGDVEPSYYGQENRGSGDIDISRDQAELALVRAFLAAGKPILAICRGHQLMNVALGGTLIQHLPDPLRPFHLRSEGESGDKIHAIRAQEGSVMRRLYGEVFSVNSYHHQAVDSLGQGLAVTATSEGGVVEAMEHTGLPILCVQFHPERMTGKFLSPATADGGKILEWFLERCREA